AHLLPRHPHLRRPPPPRDPSRDRRLPRRRPPGPAGHRRRGLARRQPPGGFLPRGVREGGLRPERLCRAGRGASLRAARRDSGARHIFTAQTRKDAYGPAPLRARLGLPRRRGRSHARERRPPAPLARLLIPLREPALLPRTRPLRPPLHPHRTRGGPRRRLRGDRGYRRHAPPL
ncbi:MAG: hypothetical protein AVDCRST_MAG05-4448, partial [uncultured Rubrobacteraceae bacterium]